ncbi:hypothetical protein JAAARDRAFT_187053 [Jaapia argillacea MUCL 33604]|uniref:DUF218 domain-containing protein n=1 Tax=Jaapia argillacea MUCL 33604 TaxID=933084 RepID=A0A067PFW7_9AGAM|nr:hypothetical protein JAAARDRAFT_187053 [Jaapia argillacea MUCL 33604]
MLPLPATFKGGFRRHATHPPLRKIDFLLSRARITNLGFLILASVCCLSLLINLSFYLARPPSFEVYDARRHPARLLDTVARDPVVRNLTHLIMVPGHAIWKGSDPSMRMEDDEWVLEPFQRGGESVNAFFEHIRQGAEYARNEADSLLVFSGGQTRPSSPSTEADSYLRLAIAASLLPLHFNRATTENYALDSYQNLLFSIARFHEYVGRYPTYITVVGFEMKRKRFVELHRKALRWPEDKFEYIGVDMEGDGEIAREGERQNALLPYMSDLYGCHPPLSSKRRGRNPFSRFHSYYTSSPEIGGLLDWCPDKVGSGESTRVYRGLLPWD